MEKPDLVEDVDPDGQLRVVRHKVADKHETGEDVVDDSNY